MLAQGCGKIINTASMASLLVPHPQKQAAYNASKAAGGLGLMEVSLSTHTHTHTAIRAHPCVAPMWAHRHWHFAAGRQFVLPGGERWQ